MTVQLKFCANFICNWNSFNNFLNLFVLFDLIAWLIGQIDWKTLRNQSGLRQANCKDDREGEVNTRKIVSVAEH